MYSTHAFNLQQQLRQMQNAATKTSGT